MKHPINDSFWLNGEAIAAFVVLALYLHACILENRLGHLDRIDIRMFFDRRRELRQHPLAHWLLEGKFWVRIPLLFWLQLLLLSFTLLSASIINRLGLSGLWWALGTGCVAILLCHQLIPFLIPTQDPAKQFLRWSFPFRLFYRLLRFICLPVLKGIAATQEEQQENEGSETAPSGEEVQAFLNVGEEEGLFEEHESHMMQQIVEFGDTIAREIMVPRTDIAAISDTSTMEELASFIVQARHSRIPVYHGTIDEIVGVVYVRNLLASLTPESLHESILPLIKPAFFVPETKKVFDLMREMQASREHLAVVVDEYGGTAGILTLEDLLEEIVGDIRDEDQTEESAIQTETDGSWTVLGETTLNEILERTGTDLYEVGCNTIAGLVIKQLGRFPTPGETLTMKDLEFQALDVDSRKIQKLKMRKLTDDE